MSLEQREIQKGVEEMGEKMSAEISGQLKEVVGKVIEKGVAMRDVLGLQSEVTEGIYGQAFRLYNSGKYKEASQLFRLLVVLNGTEVKFAMGLAACFHMMKEYVTAAELYTVCGLLDPSSPVPYYHASDCYLAIGDKASAIIALEMAVSRSKEREAFAQLKDRATLTMTKLKEELLSGKET